MKKNILLCAALALITMTGNLIAVEADVDGATPGKWTMDLDAAKNVAAEENLPIMLNFTGSDWCSWCKLMEESVFSKPEWSAWAANNLMMGYIDFPTDESLVPDKYKDRNDALSQKYSIEGYPTYVILDGDGTTELGRLGAGENKTPESFIAEIQQVLQNSSAAMDQFSATLTPEKKAAFEALTQQLADARNALDEQMKIIDEAGNKAEELQRSIMKLEDDMKDFRLEQTLSEEDLQAYRETKAKYDAAIEKIEAWIATQPAQNEENMTLFNEMRDEILSLQEQLSNY